MRRGAKPTTTGEPTEPFALEERELRLVALVEALLSAGGANRAEVALLALKLRVNAVSMPGPGGRALADLFDALLRVDPRELAEVRERLARIDAAERAAIDAAADEAEAD